MLKDYYNLCGTHLLKYSSKKEHGSSVNYWPMQYAISDISLFILGPKFPTHWRLCLRLRKVGWSARMGGTCSFLWRKWGKVATDSLSWHGLGNSRCGRASVGRAGVGVAVFGGRLAFHKTVQFLGGERERERERERLLNPHLHGQTSTLECACMGDQWWQIPTADDQYLLELKILLLDTHYLALEVSGISTTTNTCTIIFMYYYSGWDQTVGGMRERGGRERERERERERGY